MVVVGAATWTVVVVGAAVVVVVGADVVAGAETARNPTHNAWTEFGWAELGDRWCRVIDVVAGSVWFENRSFAMSSGLVSVVSGEVYPESVEKYHCSIVSAA